MQFINRYNGKTETEKVYGEFFLKFLYNTKVGLFTTDMLIRRRFFSWLYGKYAKSSLSSWQIESFIDKYNIKEVSFATKKENFKTFNDFFTRKLKSQARPIAHQPEEIAAPCDGKYLAFENLDKLDSFFVKNEKLDLNSLTYNKEINKMFVGGSMLIARLAPTDYHRFHFPADCIPQCTHVINGDYFSVNPIALKKKLNIFLANKRMTTLLTKTNVGNILMIEIGATLVGSIQQTFIPNVVVNKGTEKGFFEFGGSTVILFFEKDKIEFSTDILENTSEGLETYILMGDAIGEVK